MNPYNPDASSAQVPEAKVSAATSTAGGLLGLFAVIAVALQGSIGVFDGGVPAWVVGLTGVVVAVLTAASTYVRAYAAPHTARPDLPEAER